MFASLSPRVLTQRALVLPPFAYRLPLLASLSSFGLSSLLCPTRFRAWICTRFSLPLSISVRSCASMRSTCVHLRVNSSRPFFPLALSRLSIAPLLSRALLRFLLIMIGISLAVIARFASHFTRLMYQSLVASSMRRSILCHLRLCICVSVCSWLPAALKLE